MQIKNNVSNHSLFLKSPTRFSLRNDMDIQLCFTNYDGLTYTHASMIIEFVYDRYSDSSLQECLRNSISPFITLSSRYKLHIIMIIKICTYFPL